MSSIVDELPAVSFVEYNCLVSGSTCSDIKAIFYHVANFREVHRWISEYLIHYI